jgi:hypothetical protein
MIEPPRFCYRQGTGPLTDQLHEVAQHVAQHGDRLLIVDSVGLAMPSRSDGADANEGALKLFSALRHLGLTTLLIDHVAGADMGREGAVAKPYGSVYKFNLARNIFELRAGAPTPDGTHHLGLYHRKSNRTAKLPPVGVAIHHEPGSIWLEAEELEAAEANAAIPLHSRIHALLLSGGRDVKAIAEAANSQPNTVRAVLSRMQGMGMVTKLPGKNGIWAAVALGRADAAQHEAQRVAHPTEGDA